MRTLYLLRHAKSSRDDPTVADHDRPLTSRGVRDTTRIADYMHRGGIAPDVLLCSSSRRTRETLELLRHAVPTDCEIQVEDGLYAATVDALLERLRAVPTDVDRVFLIGHNPGVQGLALRLAASGERLAQMEAKFPTAALAILDAPIDSWRELQAGCARLTGFVQPKELDLPP